jgi:uncharacterized protein (TIGR03083 family)
MGKRTEALATQFEEAVADFAKTVEGCTDAQWSAICNAEGWTVGQLAQHVSGQIPLEMEFITAVAEGKTMPFVTVDQLNEKNESRAEKNRAVTKAAVLQELRTNAASTAAYIRALADEQLDRTGPLSLADGAELTTEQYLLSGVLIAHFTGHLESIRDAITATGVPSGARV